MRHFGTHAFCFYRGDALSLATKGHQARPGRRLGNVRRMRWEKQHGEPAPAGFRNIRVHDLIESSEKVCDTVPRNHLASAQRRVSGGGAN